MELEKLERYYTVETVSLFDSMFYVSEDEGDYIQEIDFLINHLKEMKKQGCTHTHNGLDRGFRYLSKKESLAKRIENEHKSHLKKLKELEDEYNIL